MGLAIELAEKGYLPDVILRAGIDRLVDKRRRETRRHYRDEGALRDFVDLMDQSPLATATTQANRQHYEVPPAFFEQVLGHRLKYSCALFDDTVSCLDEAEDAMLALTCERARLVDGQDILELGCGWGSLTLWMAHAFPSSRIVAVSNSAPQREFITARARAMSLANVEVITADINAFDTTRQFDRVVSVEMFEHVRNHRRLFANIAGWLRPGGLLFFHIFCHCHLPYFFEDNGEDDWMAREFFTGGMMPSWDLPLTFQDRLSLADRWIVSGVHYARTCRAWLDRLDHDPGRIESILAGGENPAAPSIQRQRWRLFFMACERLFAASGGNEWHVGHYLFARP